jgi:hypothetical protein
MRKTGYRFPNVSLAALAASGVIATGAAAEDFVTAKGSKISMPEIESMTCGEMEVTLTAIDLTRYRENAPVPHDTADKPLFVYEKKLARVHYHTCVTQTSSGLAEKELLRQGKKN